MQYCRFLVQDINLEPAAVQPCCDVHGVEVPHFPFAGGYLDMSAYAAHVAKCLERLHTDGDRLCRGCHELATLEGTEDSDRVLSVGPFRSVSINAHRYLCNCRCVYCTLWRGGHAGYPVLPVLKSLHAQQVLHSDCVFSWGGGEPSLLHDFEESSAWIRGHGWWQYIHTNALRFSPAIAELLRLGRGVINVSLDSGSPEVYHRVKGVPRFDQVCDHLKRYMEAAAHKDDIRLKYIIFEPNNSPVEVEKFFSICSRLGVSVVEYSLNFKELNGAGPSENTLICAAFFQARARALGLSCVPFFVPPQWQTAIEKHLAKF